MSLTGFPLCPAPTESRVCADLSGGLVGLFVVPAYWS